MDHLPAMDQNLTPHGYCLSWEPGLVWLHAVSDSVIALAYYSIPVMLLVFTKQRKDLQYSWMFVLFGVFIFACGNTHMMSLWTLWFPNYWAAGLIKAVTAIVSVMAAILLYRIIPQALALPGPVQWEAVNNSLRNEISERKTAEASLKESTAALVEAQHIARVGNLEWNIADNTTRWSDEIFNILGLPPEKTEASYEVFLNAVHPEDRQLVDAAVRETVEKRESSSLDYRIMRPDGTVCFVQGKAVVSDGKDGHPPRLYGTLQDITERRQAEDQIRLLAKVFESSCEAIMISDAENHIITVNPAYTQLTGHRARTRTYFPRNMRQRNSTERCGAPSMKPAAGKEKLGIGVRTAPSIPFGCLSMCCATRTTELPTISGHFQTSANASSPKSGSCTLHSMMF